MPNWTNTPPPSITGPGFRLIRTPATQSVTACITSLDMIGCATHFYQRRTLPCEGSGCTPCSEGIGWRWHGWVACILSQTQEHVLFEFTAPAADYFAKYRDQHATLRGCIFTAQRNNNRSNARVLIRCRPADLAKIQLPPAPDLTSALAHIWGIPPEHSTIQGHAKRFQRVAINGKKPLKPMPPQAV